MSEPLLYDGLPGLIRALITAPLVYLAVIALIRVSGKRTTSQLNNFDWVVTVAMGSIVASPILLENVTVAEAVVGIASLLFLQFLVTRFSVLSRSFERLVKPSPRLIAYQGELIREAMLSERITKGEVMAAVRGAGIPDLRGVAAVVLESDAKLSVLPLESCRESEKIGALSGVEGIEPGRGDLFRTSQ